MSDPFQFLDDVARIDGVDQPQLTGRLSNVDIPAELRRACSEPVGGFPSLEQSVFAGDTIAIVIQEDLPRVGEVLVAMTDLLQQTNISAADVSIVVAASTARQLGWPVESGRPAGADAAEDVSAEEQADASLDPDDSSDEADPTTAAEIDLPLFKAVRVVHDPVEETGLAYIAANAAALPMKVNRSIVDADVILPVGFPVLQPRDFSADCIYPGFASRETTDRFATGDEAPEQLSTEIEFANEQLGAFCSVQVVPVPGNKVGQIFFGTRGDAISQAHQVATQRWGLPVCDDDRMVVASIENSSPGHEWDDFVAAVLNSSRVSSSDRPIVICSSIQKKPPAAIRHACHRQFETGRGKKLTATLNQLAGIIEGRQVFLSSGLSGNVTEELGLGYIDQSADVEKLVTAHGGCVLIRDAHRCVTVGETGNVVST